MPEVHYRSQSEIAMRYMAEAPVNLAGLATELGLPIHTDSTLPPGIAGKLARDRHAPAGFRIVVNGSDNPGRQRFTIAHEIAHYMLHRDLLEDGVVDDALYRSAALSDDYEREADRFAATLVLPAPAVREAYRKDKSFAGLAKLFGVSMDAMRVRLKELGLAP